ncbi:hypothetical protein VMF7928_01042 [Vibrio marisflavi CECT 7928]|uniref:Uncharacterized protein n=1 Tax=Vibrio marisflavi CECT 7928 TaxID=634439 RepID=A0ABN8DZR1_9VIBR|nr:hypothetical protein VMF7928_01042 [Vibrio marisflavi CECT 7928]
MAVRIREFVFIHHYIGTYRYPLVLSVNVFIGDDVIHTEVWC